MKHAINIDELLLEISPDVSCGEELEYDPVFVAMEQASRGKGEHQIGDSIIPAEEADWRDVKTKALELFKRTKDLRVGVYLTQALVSVDGLVGLRDGLELVHRLIEQYWEDLHPNLDPDDNDDPTIRVNTLLNLCDQGTLLRPVRNITLAKVKGLGRFSFRDYLIADGKLAAAESSDTPQMGMAEIQAIFMGCELDELQEAAEATAQSVGLVESIESALMNKVGVKHAIGFAPIADLLKEMSGAFAAQLERRGSSAPEASEDGAGETSPAAPRLSGEINTREDVIQALDKACDYYRRNEPSSPVPLLLKRARALVSKEFMDIILDLAPGGVAEIEKIRGSDSGQG